MYPLCCWDNFHFFLVLVYFFKSIYLVFSHAVEDDFVETHILVYRLVNRRLYFVKFSVTSFVDCDSNSQALFYKSFPRIREELSLWRPMFFHQPNIQIAFQTVIRGMLNKDTICWNTQLQETRREMLESTKIDVMCPMWFISKTFFSVTVHPLLCLSFT